MNKYNAKKTEVDGIMFDSKAEASRYRVLKVFKQEGAIKDLRMQVKYELTPKMKTKLGKIERPSHYVADFVYYNNVLKSEVVEDVKGGACTQLFILKRKLMLEKYGITIIEVRK